MDAKEMLLQVEMLTTPLHLLDLELSILFPPLTEKLKLELNYPKEIGYGPLFG
jgi:hypothetical protein